MADQREITLYPGDATPNDIVLRALPVATIVETTIYLYQGDAGSAYTVVLRDPTAAPVIGGGTPVEVVLAQATWAWTAGAAAVNSKIQLALAAASWPWSAAAPDVNARTQITLAQAGWSWTAGLLGASVTTAVALAAAAAWVWGTTGLTTGTSVLRRILRHILRPILTSTPPYD